MLFYFEKGGKIVHLYKEELGLAGQLWTGAPVEELDDVVEMHDAIFGEDDVTEVPVAMAHDDDSQAIHVRVVGQ